MPSPPVYLVLYTGIVLLSLNGLFAKGIPLAAGTITQLRSMVALVTIAGVLWLWRRSLLIRHWPKALGVCLLGLLMGLHWVTFFHAMQVSTIAVGMLSLFTFPVVVVLLEAVIQRRLPRWQDSISALGVLLGVWLLTGATGVDQITVNGVFWGILSAVLFAGRNVAQKYYFADINSEQLMLYQVATVAVLLLPFVDIDGISTLKQGHWLSIVALGVITTAGAHTLLVISYKQLPATTVAMVSCLHPVIGALLAWAIFSEQPTAMVTLGGLIILAVAVYQSTSRR